MCVWRGRGGLRTGSGFTSPSLVGCVLRICICRQLVQIWYYYPCLDDYIDRFHGWTKEFERQRERYRQRDRQKGGIGNISSVEKQKGVTTSHLHTQLDPTASNCQIMMTVLPLPEVFFYHFK